MESKTVMLINSVWWRPWYFYMWRYKWYIYSVRWICICHILETEKILVFHRQPYYVILTIYRKCYDIKRNVGIVYFSFDLELCFKLRLFSRDICWFWLWQELWLYTARYLALSHAHHTLLPHNGHVHLNL